MRRSAILLASLCLSSASPCCAQVFSGAGIETAGQNVDGFGPVGTVRQQDRESGKRLFGERDEWGDEGWTGDIWELSPDRWTVGMWGSPDAIFTVDKVLGPTECIVSGRDKRGSAVFLLRGLDTSKATTGATFALLTPVVISEIFEYRAFPEDDPERLLVLDTEFEKVLGKKADLSFREWTDVSGVFKVEAKFIQYVNKAVTLEKRDGSRVAVPLSRLSESDRKFALREHELASKQKK